MKNPTRKENTRWEGVAARKSADGPASKGFGSLEVLSRSGKPVVVAAADKGQFAGVTMYNRNLGATLTVSRDKGPENVKLEPLPGGAAGA